MCALTREVEELLIKDAIEVVQPQLRLEGHSSGYFLVGLKPDKGGGLRPIMDLRRLNPCLSRIWFKMISNRGLLEGISQGEWFTSVDLEDTNPVDLQYPGYVGRPCCGAPSPAWSSL